MIYDHCVCCGQRPVAAVNPNLAGGEQSPTREHLPTIILTQHPIAAYAILPKYREWGVGSVTLCQHCMKLFPKSPIETRPNQAQWIKDTKDWLLTFLEEWNSQKPYRYPSYSEICDYLNEKGLRSFRNQPWSASNIYAFMVNRGILREDYIQLQRQTMLPPSRHELRRDVIHQSQLTSMARATGQHGLIGRPPIDQLDHLAAAEERARQRLRPEGESAPTPTLVSIDGEATIEGSQLHAEPMSTMIQVIETPLSQSPLPTQSPSPQPSPITDGVDWEKV